jgi:hypothetical protein
MACFAIIWMFVGVFVGYSALLAFNERLEDTDLHGCLKWLIALGALILWGVIFIVLVLGSKNPRLQATTSVSRGDRHISKQADLRGDRRAMRSKE